MRYEVRENEASKWGTISNSHGFLQRHMDTGFKTKWAGYWAPPVKFLDYFAFQVNGQWLDSSSLRASEYGDEIIHHHETESLSIEERVKVPEGFPGFKLVLDVENPNEDPKAVHLNLEPGIDIRERTDDVPEEDHDLKIDNERIIAKRNGRKLIISGEFDEIEDDPQVKEHFPGGEKQECLLPGKACFRKEIQPGEKVSVEVDFKTSEASFEEVEETSAKLKNSELSRCFNYSIESMENLVYGHQKGGIIAGHPWFQNYWARDSFWSVLGLVDAGMFETAEKILENFASRKGFPNKIHSGDGRSEKGGADSAPLFIIAGDKLDRHYGASDLIKEKMEEAMETLELEEGIVQHNPEGTWMDTRERSPAVDIQSLWLEAARIMESDRKPELESGLRDFERDGRVLDTTDAESPRTVNFSVPLMFGQFKDEYAHDYLEVLNGEFASRYGARTMSMVDPGYDPSGYHTGSSWGLTTCWSAMANLEYGNHQQGLNMLEKMKQFLDRNQLGALPEVVNSETGELMGCGEQAWSAALLVHAVDSHVLGIDVKQEHVEIDPVPGVEMTRLNKRVGDETIDLRVENGEVEILNSPEIEIIKW
jgi:hypothetical protein